MSSKCKCMFEDLLFVFIAVVCFFVMLAAFCEGSVEVGALALIAMFIFAASPIYAFYVPPDSVSHLYGDSSVSSEHGWIFKIPFRPVTIVPQEMYSKTKFTFPAKDGVAVTFDTRFTYVFQNPWVYPELVSTYGPNYEEKTINVMISSFYSNIAQTRSSREWFVTNTIELSESFDDFARPIMRENFMEINTNFVDIEIWLETDIYNKYGRELMETRYSYLAPNVYAMDN